MNMVIINEAYGMDQVRICGNWKKSKPLNDGCYDAIGGHNEAALTENYSNSS